MEQIDWQLLDESTFRDFCNALLLLEVSKSFVPFTAPGKDKGIDGFYKGSYNKRAGDWRFQYKYHNQSRKQNVSAIKTDLKQEIQKVGDESCFVLLTNVELLPQQRIELLLLAENELKKTDKRDIFIDIWDGAKLSALSTQYPILYFWVQEGHRTAQLVTYKSYFDQRLKNDINHLNTLGNKFVAREGDLAALREFLSSDNTMLVISGEAGIGKTRLVIEFFNRVVDKDNSWQALVLNTRTPNLNYDRISLALKNTKNTVILIDDAHNFPTSVIADFKGLSSNDGEYKVKTILTTRIIFDHEIRRIIPALERELLQALQLKKLSLPETHGFFLDNLKGSYLINYADQLSAISNGRPILMVAIVRAVKLKNSIPTIKTDVLLNEYVIEYFESAIKQVSEDFKLGHSILANLVQVICLIEPIDINNEAVLSKICDFAKVERETLFRLVEKLIDANLAVNNFQFSISPDYYSDIYLNEIPNELLTRTVSSFPEFTSHIIINLIGADESESERLSTPLVDQIISIYISKFKDANATDALAIIETISGITYNRPDFAPEIVSILTARLKDPNEGKFVSEVVVNKENKVVFDDRYENAISEILSELLNFSERSEFVFTKLLELYQLVPDSRLFNNTFGFTKREFIMRLNLYNQNFFVDRCFQLVSNKEATAYPFIVSGFTSLLKLEHQFTSMDFVKRGSLNISTYYLPTAVPVSDLRVKVLNGLISIYQFSNDSALRRTAFEEILDVPRSILATKRNKAIYEGDREIKVVLDFIAVIARSTSLSEKKEIRDKLFWYKKWGINPDFNPVLLSIESEIEPTTLSENLLKLLTDNELHLSPDYQKSMMTIRQSCGELFKKHSSVEITESLNSVFASAPRDPNIFWNCLMGLVDNIPDKTIDVLDKLVEQESPIFFTYGSYFLHSIRYKHKIPTIFWERVEKFEGMDDYRYTNVVLHVYTINMNQLADEKDLVWIERTFNKNIEHTGNMFSLVLIVVFDSNKSLGKKLIVRFIDSCPPRFADNFFTFFSFKERDYSFSKYLVLNHTLRFRMSFEIQNSLKRILSADIDEGIEYFMRRFHMMQQRIREHKYDYEFVPPASEYMMSLPIDIKFAIYVKAVEWYLSLDLPFIEEHYAIDLLEFFQPSDSLDVNVFRTYNSLLKGATKSRLVRMATSLAVFKRKNEQLVDLVLEVRKQGISIDNSNDFRSDLESRCYNAITSVGVKVGGVGEAFQVDSDLLDLIKISLEKHSGDLNTYEFLDRIRKSISSNMERDVRKDLNDDLW